MRIHQFLLVISAFLVSTILLTTSIFGAKHKTLENSTVPDEVQAICKTAALKAGALFLINISAKCVENEISYIYCRDVPIKKVAEETRNGMLRVYNKCILELINISK
jgi:hypothetical protein